MDPPTDTDASTNPDSTRPQTPESPLQNSLYVATSTIDELTAALADFSRTDEPEPPVALECCCGKDDCEKLKTWLDVKSGLDHRLILSAEVGQALLQRHEAYVREGQRRERIASTRGPETPTRQFSTELLQEGYDELVKEKARLEKSLNQALANNAVTEVSNNTILKELQEARDTISRLTAHNVRAIGWDTKLSTALRERDDMQQERDSETHRARLAESRFAALKEKTAKLQSEVRRLQASLEEKRQSRLESSETILQDARTRIESFRNVQSDLTAQVEQQELTSVLESLVKDNETLKKDNAELQNLLAESREDLHAMQEELEEHRAWAPSRPISRASSTTQSRHYHTSSVPSVSFNDYTTPFTPQSKTPFNRAPNTDGPGRTRTRGVANANANANANNGGHKRLSPVMPEPPTPLSPANTYLSPDAPDNSVLGPGSIGTSRQWSPFNPRLSPKYPPSNISYEIEEDAAAESSATNGSGSGGVEDTPVPVRVRKPLRLLTRSRGVQTDPPPQPQPPQVNTTASPRPSQLSSISPLDPRSESSSYSESPPSQLGAILERISALSNRLSQADALTLTNRLKRQNLLITSSTSTGIADSVSHLSRSTVNSVLNDLVALRGQFRFLLEDEKVVTSCYRKDVRLLFKVVREMFVEMGQMRVVLNDVVLDPGCAGGVSEAALNPGRGDGLGSGVGGAGDGGGAGSGGGGGGKDEGLAALVSAAGWMAPISKLFSPTGGASGDANGGGASALGRSQSQRHGSRGPRPVPKLAPALGSSTTTVKVEFSGSGVGRAITSTSATTAATTLPASTSLTTIGPSESTTSSMVVSPSQGSGLGTGMGGGAAGLMGIFAGAPQGSMALEPDPWVVLPSVSGSTSGSASASISTSASISGTGTVRKAKSFIKPTNSSRVSEFGSLSASVSSSTIGRHGMTMGGRRSYGPGGSTGYRRFSRNVDAVIDDFEHPKEEDEHLGSGGTHDVGGNLRQDRDDQDDDDDDRDVVAPLSKGGRTLHRRGLSDSSIHSTFTTHGNEDPHNTMTTNGISAVLPPSPTGPLLINPQQQQQQQSRPLSRMAAWPDTASMFQALTRTMKTFKSTAESFAGSGTFEGRAGGTNWTKDGSLRGSGGGGYRTQANGTRPPPLRLTDPIVQPVDNSATTLNSSSSSSQHQADVEPAPLSPPPTVSVVQPQSQIRNSLPPTPTRSEAASSTSGSGSGSNATVRPSGNAVAARAIRGGGRDRDRERRILPSWAGHEDMIDPMAAADPFVASSLRDESLLSRMARGRGGGDAHGRDFF